MRSLLLAAAAALLFASAATAATTTPPPGPYKLDANGRCHAKNGQFVVASLCKGATTTTTTTTTTPPTTTPAVTHATTPPTTPPKRCRDPKTKRFESCSKPGAVPVT